MVLGSEVGVDVFKHAFVSKFNGLRPRVYRGFFRQLCREHVKLTQSYKLHRVVGFVPLAPAAVLLARCPGLYRTFGAGSGGGSGSRGLFFGFSRDVLAFARDTARSAPARRSAWRASRRSRRSRRSRTKPKAPVSRRRRRRSSTRFRSLRKKRLATSQARFFSAGAVSETAGFALLFAFLVVFKLAFGVALHWFGARMLDTLPKDVGGGRKKEPKRRAGNAPPSPPTRGATPGRARAPQKKERGYGRICGSNRDRPLFR